MQPPGSSRNNLFPRVKLRRVESFIVRMIELTCVVLVYKRDFKIQDDMFHCWFCFRTFLFYYDCSGCFSPSPPVAILRLNKLLIWTPVEFFCCSSWWWYFTVSTDFGFHVRHYLQAGREGNGNTWLQIWRDCTLWLATKRNRSAGSSIDIVEI